MADSCREQITAAVLGRLQTIVGVTVERNRAPENAIEESECPIVLLYEQGETARADFVGVDSYTLDFDIIGAVDNASDVNRQKDLNDLRAKVRQAVLADVSLSGKAWSVSLAAEAPPTAPLSASAIVETFVVGLTVEYSTVEGDPFTFS